MNVFQVLLTDSPIATDDLPPSIIMAMQSARDCFPYASHHFLQRPELEDFLCKYFDKSVLDVFRGFVPYAYQSDFARYCLLYVHGGWYVDITLKILTSVCVSSDIDMIVFADRGCSSMCEPWAIQNGLFYSKPGNPILLRVIKRISDHFHRRYYGHSPLSPTGPNCFGIEVASGDSNLNIVKGFFQPLTPTFPFKNLMYVAQSGQLIAQHRTSWLTGSEGGDFSVTQITGVNNYKDLWSQHQVYR